jgi:FixJ family two-component response regulator
MPPLKPGTVFLVDDDGAVRKALERLIRSAGYEVVSLLGPASYMACTPPTAPACLVLDIRMPGMSGFDLHDAIAGTPWALPTVFITGHGGEDVRGQALSLGAVEVLSKPIDEEALIVAIDRALRKGTGRE